MPLVAASKTLRHSTLSTTANIYDHVTRQAAADAVDTIAAILAQADRDAARFHWPRWLRPHRDHGLPRQEHPARPNLPALAAV